MNIFDTSVSGIIFFGYSSWLSIFFEVSHVFTLLGDDEIFFGTIYDFFLVFAIISPLSFFPIFRRPLSMFIQSNLP